MNKPYSIVLGLATALATVGCGENKPKAKSPKRAAAKRPYHYLDRRAALKTNLIHKGPSRQSYENETPPKGVKEITYTSGDLELRAWVYKPNTRSRRKRPALVYFHGGFAFGKGDMLACKPFIKAGFVVMTPMLRGENGNPGNFEMFYGEVDDARAAINWLASQSYVDPNRIFGFGHSAGGVISALLSLYPDSGLRHSGSSGGLYGPDTFSSFDATPFDFRSEEECALRCLVGNVKEMKKPHYAYVGDRDYGLSVDRAEEEVAKGGKLLTIVKQKGDHFSVLPEAFELYLAQVKADLKKD